MNGKETKAPSEHDLPPQDQIGFIMQEVGTPGGNDSEIPRLIELRTIVAKENCSAEEIDAALKEAWEILKRKENGTTGYH